MDPFAWPFVKVSGLSRGKEVIKATCGGATLPGGAGVNWGGGGLMLAGPAWPEGAEVLAAGEVVEGVEEEPAETVSVSSACVCPTWDAMCEGVCTLASESLQTSCH